MKPVPARLLRLLTGLGGALVILMVVLAVYRSVWMGMGQPDLLPWGSDTLGHLLRYEFIRDNILAGNWYPQIMPQWYMGMQLLRYYAPIPYYVIFMFDRMLDSPTDAISAFILFWTAVGGLSWLAFRRYLGVIPSILCGGIFVLLPDQIRVGFSEGNLPRVMAAGITPLLLYLALRIVENGGNRFHRAGLAFLFAVVTLTHAMMAAIYAAALGLLVGLIWLWRRCWLRNAVWVMAWVALGIGAAGAWLLPSLTGGITELESGSVDRGIIATGWAELLNPLGRLHEIETPYVGVGLIGAALAGVVVSWKRKNFAGASVTAGAALAFLVTPELTALFQTLPLSSLLWPVRFLSFASCFMLFGFALCLKDGWAKAKWATALAVGLVVIDCGISTRLIFMRSLNPDLATVSQAMAPLAGWREATLDESRLGSAASWLFSSQAGREQVFGWGYQGARTAHNVASLNDALANGSLGYLEDRLALFGVDDLVLLHSLRNAGDLEKALPDSEFELIQQTGTLSYYHRDGQPRAISAAWQGLGVGQGAQSYAYLFPQIVLGNSPYLDDYSSEELSRYPVLILAGFRWHDRAAAEEAAREAARNGTRVYVDLTRIPVDPLSQIPRFLDVWGETVILPAQAIEAAGGERAVHLAAFGSNDELWHTVILQNLEHEVVVFDYLGKRAVLTGYNQYGQGRVWFIGANLAYHALLTRDKGAAELLADLIQLPAGEPTHYQALSLEDYRAGAGGYSFTYTSEEDQEIVFPVARLDGSALRLDGKDWPLESVENLALFAAPAGKHRVEILYSPTSIYTLGMVVSGGSLLAVAALTALAGFKWRGRGRRNDEPVD